MSVPLRFERSGGSALRDTDHAAAFSARCSLQSVNFSGDVVSVRGPVHSAAMTMWQGSLLGLLILVSVSLCNERLGVGALGDNLVRQGGLPGLLILVSVCLVMF